MTLMTSFYFDVRSKQKKTYRKFLGCRQRKIHEGDEDGCKNRYEYET